MTDQEVFIDAFDKDLIGTTYDTEKYSVHFVEDIFEVLEYHQYVKKTIVGNRSVWIKIKSLPSNFDFLDAKDEYIFAEPEEFLKDFRLAAIGTKFYPDEYKPADISFQIEVLEYGKYIASINDGKNWIKTKALPDNYNYGKEADLFITFKQMKKDSPEKIN